MTFRPNMLNDAVPEVIQKANNECESFESSHQIICSDGNNAGSECRRFDCKSNHAICNCSNGECNWSAFELLCFKDAEIAIGCDVNGNDCNGCDLPDWLSESNDLIGGGVQCTNYNYENSKCYRDNCLSSSSYSRCICVDERCFWDTVPECLWTVI